MATLPILEYLTKHDIAWIPINITVTAKGAKEPLLPVGYRGPENNKKWIHFAGNPTKDELTDIQSHVDECNAIAIDTRKIQQYDVDEMSDDIPDLMKQYPYFESYKKGYPHFFFSSPTAPTKSRYKPSPGIDLLTGSWSYCRKDAKVFNNEADMMPIDLATLDPKPKTVPKATSNVAWDAAFYEQQIQTVVPHHSNTKVKKIKEDTGAICTDGLWCANIGREHQSNHVYFVVRRGCLIQKCTDPDCDGFESEPYSLTERTSSDGTTVISDDNEGADYFIELNKDILKKTKDGRIFIYHGDKWTEQHLDQVLMAKLLESKIEKATKGKSTPYSANVSGAKALIQAVKAKLVEDPTFLDRLWTSSLGRAYWQNGYWDFGKGEFVESVAPEDSMTTVRIPHKFPAYDEAKVNMVNSALFGTIFKGKAELATNYLEHCARALGGCIEDKDWLVCIGERNSGKGTLQAMHEAAWNPYVLTLDGGAFLIERSNGGGDAAKKNSAFIDAEYKRFLFTQEMTYDKDTKVKLNGGLIKGKLASGGDTLCARKNYKDEINFKVQARCFISCNDLPPVTPADALQTCSIFQMRAVFSEDESGDSWVQKADPDIKRKCQSDDWVAGFTHLVLKSFKPHKVVPCMTLKLDTDKFKIDGGEEWSVIKEYFKVTGFRGDILTSNDVQTWLNRIGINMSPQKVKSRLELMGATHDKNTPGGRGWRGVKLVKEVVVPDQF